MVAYTNPLPAKAARFIDEYLLDHNGTAAAVRAGYSVRSAPVTASRLLRKANVVEVLAKKQRDLATQFQLGRNDVIERLQRAAEMAEAKYDAAGMVAAWREIGKLIGAYPTVTRKAGVAAKPSRASAEFDAMTDTELMAVIDNHSITTINNIHIK